ncbi:hypothetical protein R0F62_04810 [Wolbachia endosymbiont of Drosophila aff. chauvacae BK-2020]|uniref:hypothetical protein n=1 Tax=unclassified Wolbachia TaxID=2640676 RepID=UPI0023A9243B|nr:MULTISPECIES: hypothetical protein [unclassified Wolbachia]MDE5059855.1 hypothetical protein [Wolbachia endosymbiont of Drosophila burlai]MDE5063093.1 hypothetical protein [Wolbachia endosymbiont of Drosophila chauvacae]MDU8909081.1 hypothetical protein [Wolbachia endosymbiont of Drosophila bocqueti]WOE62461.1 hypothetical protein R0F62_04810 [Wolbachia endosymbiont of Drosophila aff. chauvacae BK-2020]
MKFEMSEENSKRVLSGTKWITNVGQNYLTSLNNSTKPTSSGKKLINAFLLVPIIVPTAITALSLSLTMLFLNAVNVQKDDSKLSKVIKFIVSSLIYIAATVVLIPCIVLNLIISLIPGLIFYYIHKDIENSQGQPVNKVEISNDKEYNERVEKEASISGTDQHQNNEEHEQNELRSNSQSNSEQHHSACNQALVSNGQLHNQPTVEVISREVGNTRFVDQTVIAKDINNDGIRDGGMVMRTVGNDRNFTVCGVVTGNATNKQEGFATAMGFSCNIVANGIDFQLGCSMRTGTDKKQAIKHLKQSESARTLLSGDSGILSIEQFGSSQRKQ